MGETMHTRRYSRRRGGGRRTEDHVHQNNKDKNEEEKVEDETRAHRFVGRAVEAHHIANTARRPQPEISYGLEATNQSVALSKSKMQTVILKLQVAKIAGE